MTLSEIQKSVASNHELINELWIKNAVEEGRHDPFQSSTVIPRLTSDPAN